MLVAENIQIFKDRNLSEKYSSIGKGWDIELHTNNKASVRNSNPFSDIKRSRLNKLITVGQKIEKGISTFTYLLVVRGKKTYFQITK